MTEPLRDGAFEHTHGSSESTTLDSWSRVDFLHRAQVLARRLAGWHFDDGGPVWTPEGVDFLREVERSFRHRVLRGRHDPKPPFGAPIRLLPTDSDGSGVGQAIPLHPNEYRKDETIWLLRDYYEHLAQLGDSDVEKLLRWKVDQLLDSRMYRSAHSEALGDYIGGNRVDQVLLDELVDAARILAFPVGGALPHTGITVDERSKQTPKTLAGAPAPLGGHPGSANAGEPDDAMPKALRANSRSRIKAKSAYEYAMERIPDANEMTATELFDAIKQDGEAAEMLPPSAESFTKYLNDCHIRLKKSDSKTIGGSVVRKSDL